MCSKTSVLRPFRLSRCLPQSAVSAVLLAGLWSPGSSFAQSIELAPTQFRILRAEERLSSQYPFWLNRRDCQEDIEFGDGETQIVINPRVSPVGSKYAFQAWVGVGVDCTKDEERLTTGRCWMVLNEIPRVSGTEYYIYPQMIMGKGANPPPADVCDTEVEWATTLYFLLLNGGTVLASTMWDQTQVDTRAPAPPTLTSVAGGDSRIFVEWNVPIDEVDVDAEGYRLYCANGAEVPGGGGQGGAGGAGGAGPSCVGAPLVPGDFPPEDPTNPEAWPFCGEATGLARQGASTNAILTNYQTYALGVASTDRVGNIGKLSELDCATPGPVIGFFERYRDAGGQGGGGFCGFSPSAREHLWLLGLFAVAWGAFRQRRRRPTC